MNELPPISRLKRSCSSRLKQPRHKENNRDHSIRRNEASTEKRTNMWYVPYVAKKDEPKKKAREETTIRPRFRVSSKELLSMQRVADKLKFPQKTNRFLGSRGDSWCDFHREFGHSIERCIALRYQLASLVKEGFLKEYIEANQEEPKREATTMDQTHETLIHGDLNTITRGFSGAGNSVSKRKQHARAVMSLYTRRSDHPTEPSL